MDQALTIFDILHSQGDERTVDRMKRIFLKCLLKDGLNGGCRKRMARTKESMYEQNFQTSTKQEEDQGEEIYLRLHFLFFSLSLFLCGSSQTMLLLQPRRAPDPRCSRCCSLEDTGPGRWRCSRGCPTDCPLVAVTGIRLRTGRWQPWVELIRPSSS